MKKILTLVVAIAITTTTFSQWTINAGGNISQFAGVDAQGSTKFGYQIGATTYSNKLFSVQPGIFLINKGAKDVGTTASLSYLQLPVNLMLGYNINEELRIIVGAGAYAGLGIFGHTKTDGKSKEKIEFFNLNDPFKALDFGWQFIIGAQQGRYGVKLSYQRGLTKVMGGARWEEGKIVNYKDPGPKKFNDSFIFGVTYTLGDMNPQKK